MGKKLGLLASFFYRMAGAGPSPSSSWPWPSCKHPRTHSFRRLEGRKGDGNEDRNGMNSSSFTSSSAAASESFSEEASAGDVIRGLRSDDRLFFEPASSTSSIVEETSAKPAGNGSSSSVALFEGSIAMAVDSVDPYLDFKVSMEEMIVAYGVEEWEWLEEMLVWYLRMNSKRIHGVIVGAFLDLLPCLVCSSPASSSCF